MISTAIFDLDGTLVKTERLKALSYAKAAVELCPYTISEEQVLDAFKDVVGLPRREVATSLVERFDLDDKASARMDEFGVSTPWQAYVQVRLNYYDDMINDPAILKDNQWPHAIELLHDLRSNEYTTALATMSHCEQANYVLNTLDLVGQFDFIATRDDVEHGKPNPEIYELVATQLKVEPQACIVMEDSPSGVKAALNAQMTVVAIGTPFTIEKLQDLKASQDFHLVEDSVELMAKVQSLL